MWLLVAAFVPEGPLVFGIDGTIERRRGAKIKAASIYRDPVRSSHSHLVKVNGLRWLWEEAATELERALGMAEAREDRQALRELSPSGFLPSNPSW